jgi:methylenetetrahydrofolate dehydrogenase (NADP+)/methenyltetrahydrofolate cyclohydrolase
MKIISGKELADEIKAHVKQEADIVKNRGESINFAAVIAGNNPASLLYIARKQETCEKVGINMRIVNLDAKCTQKQLNDTIANLSKDKNTHAILLQLPLPDGLNARTAISFISPEKDADGLTAENFGRLATGEPGLAPCTALGIVHILKTAGVKISGADVCIIGRSDVVGKPTALMLSSMDATVTICHSKTKKLTKFTKSADIIIVAAGCPKLLRADMVKKGAAIIDVGINRLESGEICGDVDFEEVSKKASLITPVPGGVGPLTIAFLLSNIVQAYKGGNINV